MIQKQGLVVWVAVLLSFNYLFGRFKFDAPTSGINLLGTAQLSLSNSINNFNGSLYIASPTSNSLVGSGTAVNFQQGVYQTGSSPNLNLTAALSSTGSDSFTLANGNQINALAGTILNAISVANGATATIIGQPTFGAAITLGDASSVLNLGISSELNQSVTGSGTLALLDNLFVLSGVQLPALVMQNNKCLNLLGGSFSTAVTNTTGGVISIHSYINLTQPWTIGSSGDVYTIEGNGNVLEFTGNGGIVFNGATLYLSNVTIKGINTAANNLGGTGLITILSNTSLILNGDYTLSAGDIYVAGSGSQLVTDNHLFTVSNNRTLTVDDVVFYYLQLNVSGANPFVYTTGGSLVALNNGNILPAGSGSAATNTVNDSASTTWTQDYFLQSAATYRLNNSVPATPRTMVVDGGGHMMHFPNATGSFLIFDANVQATFQNMVLKNFNPAAISYGANATLTFGDNVYILLGKDLVIASGDKAWSFAGNGVIDGNGKRLTIQKAAGITITGAKSLSFKNMSLSSTVADGFTCLTDDATLCLDDVSFYIQQNDFNFSTGSFMVTGRTRFIGAPTSGNATAFFRFNSGGSFTIGDAAAGQTGCLEVTKTAGFYYNADPVLNSDSYAASKRHLIFAYPESTLHLNGCTLQSTATGLALNSGTLNIENDVTWITSTATGAAGELNSTMQVNLFSGAQLDLHGPVEYTP